MFAAKTNNEYHLHLSNSTWTLLVHVGLKSFSGIICKSVTDIALWSKKLGDYLWKQTGHVLISCS